MAGTCPISRQTVLSIMPWVNQLASPDGWIANDLHIDEIHGFKKIKRYDWVQSCLRVFPLVLHLGANSNDLKFFLCFSLMDAVEEDSVPQEITVQWLQDNLDAMTPPSFNACSEAHWESFYLKEIQACTFSENLKINSVDFFVGAHAIYNPSEGAYERAIYCFALSVDWAALTLPSEYMDHGEEKASTSRIKSYFHRLISTTGKMGGVRWISKWC